ncbi:MAG: hypothetical protein WBO24_09540 [Nitrospirales bacterium]
MILANIATLLDVSPRELTDWFWVAYVDAFDWVVEPNVLAMGTFGTGPLMTTKPYISGAAYIHRMSDFCTGCAFNPKTNCPLTNLYWAFLDRHKMKLQSNPRLMLPFRNLQKRGQATIRRDRQIFTMVQRELKKSAGLNPVHLLLPESGQTCSQTPSLSKNPDGPVPDPPGCVPQQPGKISLDRFAHFH